MPQPKTPKRDRGAVHLRQSDGSILCNRETTRNAADANKVTCTHCRYRLPEDHPRWLKRPESTKVKRPRGKQIYIPWWLIQRVEELKVAGPTAVAKTKRSKKLKKTSKK